MLEPKEAYDLLLERGLNGVDDPHDVSYPRRWWFDADGVLRTSLWRSGFTRSYPEFRRPAPVCPGGGEQA